jgi:hypothetical protein
MQKGQETREKAQERQKSNREQGPRKAQEYNPQQEGSRDK